MPRALAARPRKMLPPPTTMAISVPSVFAALIWDAMPRTTSGSIPYSCSPMSASPESFRSTRRGCAFTATRAGSAITSGGLVGRWPGGLADAHAREACDPDVLAQQCHLLADQVGDPAIGVPVRLLEQADGLEPLVQLALDDHRNPIGRAAVALGVDGE